MRYLGPLSSGPTTSSRVFYVDLQNQLDTNESLSTISLSCDDSDVTLGTASMVAIDTTTKDGHILPASKSIYFRATCAASKTAIVAITIIYSTDGSNSDSTIVYLRVVPAII